MIGQKTRDNCIVNAMSLPFLWSMCNHVGTVRFLKLRASFFSWTKLQYFLLNQVISIKM